jgi:hypothetical protein
MAEVAKFITPSLATKLPCDAHRTHNLFPAEDIAAGDACYISATGVRRSTGAAVAPAAKVDGWAMMDYKVGGTQPMTLYHGVEIVTAPPPWSPARGSSSRAPSSAASPTRRPPAARPRSRRSSTSRPWKARPTPSSYVTKSTY